MQDKSYLQPCQSGNEYIYYQTSIVDHALYEYQAGALVYPNSSETVHTNILEHEPPKFQMTRVYPPALPMLSQSYTNLKRASNPSEPTYNVRCTSELHISKVIIFQLLHCNNIVIKSDWEEKIWQLRSSWCNKRELICIWNTWKQVENFLKSFIAVSIIRTSKKQAG